MTPERIQAILEEKKKKDQPTAEARRRNRVDWLKKKEKREVQKAQEDAEEAKLIKRDHNATGEAHLLWKKHFDSPSWKWRSRGKTVVRRRIKDLRKEADKIFKDNRTGKQRQVDANLEKLSKDEMSNDQVFEAGVNEIDALRYIPVDWGKRKPPKSEEDCDNGESKRKKRKLLFNKKQTPKPKVPEHFDGLIKLPTSKTADHVLEDIDPKWVRYVFNPVFVALVKTTPMQWWPVPVGNKRNDDDSKKAPHKLMTSVEIKYPQQDKNECVFKATASALYYCGMKHAATHFSRTAASVQYLPRTLAIKTLQDNMIVHAPEIAKAVSFNRSTTRRKKNHLSITKLVETKTRFPTMVIPRGHDGSASHAIVVVDDLIFDATQLYAMKLCQQSLDWICGKCGIGDIELALRFWQPSNTKRRYERPIQKNW